jgi:hypothetical protein
MDKVYNESQDSVNKVRSAPSAFGALLGGGGGAGDVGRAPLTELIASVFGSRR